jgi:hypothetical protein
MCIVHDTIDNPGVEVEGCVNGTSHDSCSSRRHSSALLTNDSGEGVLQALTQSTHACMGTRDPCETMRIKWQLNFMDSAAKTPCRY